MQHALLDSVTVLYVTSAIARKLACGKFAKENGWWTSHVADDSKVADDSHVAHDSLVAADSHAANDSIAEFEKKERDRESANVSPHPSHQGLGQLP